MFRLIHIAVRNLLLSRRRTLLLGGAIVLVTLLYVLLGAVGAGIQSTIMEAGTSLFSGHVNVGGFYKVSAGRAAPFIQDGDQVVRDLKASLPEARMVVTRDRGLAKLVSDRESVQTSLMGVHPAQDEPIGRMLKVTSGDLDSLNREKTILLFEAQARKLRVVVGDMVTLSAPTVRGMYNSVDVTVGAIAKDMGILSIMSALVSRDVLPSLYLYGEGSTGWVLVYLDHPEMAEEAEAVVRKGLEDRGHRLVDKNEGPYWGRFQMVMGEDWTGQKLDTTTWEDELMMMQWTLKVFDTVTGLLISILIVIIVVGVMNTLWISIRDRTREIGTLRAIGMGRFKVMGMFLVEVLVLSLVGSAVGVALGAGLVSLLNALELPVTQGFQLFLMSDTLRLHLSWNSVLQALLLIPTLTTLASVFPATRAARMRPITAIHHVG